MTQIILDGVYLPQMSHDRYACWEEELAETVTMVSGRVVKEIRGTVWKARWACDVLDDETYKAALAVLRSGASFPAAVLPDNGGELVSSTFLVESITPATFAFAASGKAIWRGLAFQIREVEPHA